MLNPMLKRFVMFALLAGGLASAKSYTFAISEVNQAGSTQLKPGFYTLKVDEQKVELIELKTGKPVETKAKVEEGDKKFETTSVSTSKAGSVIKIDSIGLAGTKSKVVFQ
jgi:hypothetical protein